MDFYHGTVIGDLIELHPFTKTKNNLKEAYVYLTTSKQLALHYIMDEENRPPKWPMLDIRNDGVLVFQEMFSGALEYFYKGLCGYIYHCIGDYEISVESGVKSCAVSTAPVPIVDYDYINDVYDKIIEYEKYGMFIREKYEELPQYRHDIIRGIIMRTIKKDNLISDKAHSLYNLFHEKYPQYMNEAEVLSNHGLL